MAVALRPSRTRVRSGFGRLVTSPELPSIAELKAGSEEAWIRAVDVLGPPLRGFAAVRGSRDPDETLSQVFLDLARGIESFDGDWDSLRTLAFVIARRRVVDDIRYRSRRPTEPWPVDAIERRGVGGDVEEEAMANLDRERLLDLLAGLTPIQRDVLTMRIVAGLTVREIAAITDSSIPAVKANQRRAVAALRRRLTQSESEPEPTRPVEPSGEVWVLP